MTEMRVRPRNYQILGSIPRKIRSSRYWNTIPVKPKGYTAGAGRFDKAMK